LQHLDDNIGLLSRKTKAHVTRQKSSLSKVTFESELSKENFPVRVTLT